MRWILRLVRLREFEPWGKGPGGQFLHVAIDDHSRTAYLELLPDELGVTVSAFVRRALGWFRA